MIGNRSAYRGKRMAGGRELRGKPYGEKIMRGGDDNTELARASAGPPPPLWRGLRLDLARDSKSHAT